MNMKTPEQFRAAWCDEWNTRYAADKSHVDELFSGKSTPWTEYMLTGDNAFLTGVAKKLGFECGMNQRTENVYQFEYNEIDMILAEETKDGYPLIINVAIEHENQSSIESEMRRLIFLRAPLKIIVFYAHPPKDQHKINEMLEMLKKANGKFPESKNTVYLFIVGRLEDSGICWQWASDQKKELGNLC